MRIFSVSNFKMLCWFSFRSYLIKRPLSNLAKLFIWNLDSEIPKYEVELNVIRGEKMQLSSKPVFTHLCLLRSQINLCSLRLTLYYTFTQSHSSLSYVTNLAAVHSIKNRDLIFSTNNFFCI